MVTARAGQKGEPPHPTGGHRRGVKGATVDVIPTSNGNLESALGFKGLPLVGFHEVVDAVVAFANRDISPAWNTRVFWEGSYPVAYGAELEELPPIELAKLAESNIEKDRQLAREMLDLASSEKPRLVAWLKREMPKQNSPVFFLPRLIFNETEVQLQFTMRGADHSGAPWICFAAAVLAETTRGAPTVGKCRLSTCGRYFSIERGKAGRPQTEFCCKAHRDAQHALDSAERQRRSRAARKAVKKSPRRVRR